MSDPDPRYRATLAASYDSITAETAMKIADLQPQRGQFDFTVADAMVAFAEQHGQQVFGHTLSWCTDSTMPGWLRNGSWSRASLLSVLEQHITAVMTHFRGRVAAWDVVNEALNDDGTRRELPLEARDRGRLDRPGVPFRPPGRSRGKAVLQRDQGGRARTRSTRRP